MKSEYAVREREFRVWAKRTLPHVKVRVKTIGFLDLARGIAKQVTIEGATHREDVFEASAKARELGLSFTYGVVTLPSRSGV